MFIPDMKGSLTKELGMTKERGDEIIRILFSIMNKEITIGNPGRTSHVLLDIAGRKDLSDIEKVACAFVFTCKVSGVKCDMGIENEIGDEIDDKKIDRDDSDSIKIEDKDSDMPKIFPGEGVFPFGIFPIMHKMKNTEFLDPEIGVAGMVSAPPGVGKEELIDALMVPIISILRQMPKKEAIEFCRKTSISYAKMALTGDINIKL